MAKYQGSRSSTLRTMSYEYYSLKLLDVGVLRVPQNDTSLNERLGSYTISYKIIIKVSAVHVRIVAHCILMPLKERVDMGRG